MRSGPDGDALSETNRANAEIKQFDPTRRARIAAMKGTLRGTGLSLKALMTSRAEDVELEEQKAKDCGP